MSSKDLPSTDAAPGGDSAGPRSRRSIVAIVLGVLFVLYVGAGYFVVPRVVDSQLVRIVEEQTGVRPELEGVAFDPFDWRLSILGFSLPDPAGGDPAVAFDALEVNVRVLELLVLNLALEEVLLVAPRISAVLDVDGELNFLALLPASDPAEKKEEAPIANDEEGGLIVDVESIRIERGALRFQDRSQVPVFDVRVTPLDLTVEGFTTRAGVNSPYALNVRIGEQTELDWRGTIGLDPIRSEGEIAITGFDLRLPWDFLSDRLRFEVAEGRLGAATRYVLSGGEGLEFTLSEGSLTIEDIDIRDRADGAQVISVPSLALTNITASGGLAGLASLTVGVATLDSARIDSRIEGDGTVALVELVELFEIEATAPSAEKTAPNTSESALNAEADLIGTMGESDESEASTDSGKPVTPAASLAAAPDDPAEAKEPAPAPAPEIRIERVQVRNFELAMEDRSPARTVPIEVGPLSLDVTGISSKLTSELGVTLKTGIGEGGTLTLSGPLTLKPLAAQLAIEATTIGLGVYQPYLEDVASLDIPTGSLSAALAVGVASQANGPLSVTAKGRIQVDDLLTIDRRLSRKFLEWQSLRIEGLDYSAERVGIDEIALAGALAHFVIGIDGRTNVESIFAGGSPEPSDDSSSADASSEDDLAMPAADASASASPKVEIGKIILDGIGAKFDDLTLDPHFAISLDDLTGVIEGLSSDNLSRAQLNLTGRVDDVAPVRIEGQINPLSGDAYTDIAIRVEGISLPAFTPYSSRFVGYRIERGKLGLDLDYKLNGRHLEAKNLVILDQFDFGDRVESEEATGLPVGLAVAILRDPKGNINIPLPIEGDVDDPSFSILGLLGKALVNLVTRVAMSPFAAVAGLVGVSSDDLAVVNFESGSERITEEERVELDTLAAVLVKRPELQLEIRGRADPAVDEGGLRRKRIEAEVRLAAFKSLSRRERQRVGEPAALDLADDDRLDGLTQMYRDRIGGRVRDLIPEADDPPRGPGRTRALSDAALEALAAQIVIGDADCRTLARARAAAIQGAMLASELVSADRVVLVDVEVGPVGEADRVPTELALSTE